MAVGYLLGLVFIAFATALSLRSVFSASERPYVIRSELVAAVSDAYREMGPDPAAAWNLSMQRLSGPDSVLLHALSNPLPGAQALEAHMPGVSALLEAAWPHLTATEPEPGPGVPSKMLPVLRHIRDGLAKLSTSSWGPGKSLATSYPLTRRVLVALLVLHLERRNAAITKVEPADSASLLAASEYYGSYGRWEEIDGELVISSLFSGGRRRLSQLFRSAKARLGRRLSAFSTPAAGEVRPAAFLPSFGFGPSEERRVDQEVDALMHDILLQLNGLHVKGLASRGLLQHIHVSKVRLFGGSCARAHTHTHARTHTRARARTHTHTHTHTELCGAPPSPLSNFPLLPLSFLLASPCPFNRPPAPPPAA